MLLQERQRVLPIRESDDTGRHTTTRREAVFLTQAGLVGLRVYLCRVYLDFMVRIFQEKPLFVVPRGQPIAEAEDVTFLSGNGLRLRGLKNPGWPWSKVIQALVRLRSWRKWSPSGV